MEQMARLKGIIDRLRSPGGCPWDLEQTPESLRPFLIEEAHEVAEAISGGDEKEICEELGDLLMNIVLQARIGEERGTFTLEEVAGNISDKLVRRHPHVFGDLEATDSDTVRLNWERIKRQERGEEEVPESAIRPLPASMPALLRADRIGKMAAEIGFDWPDPLGPMAKVEEELLEVKEVIDSGDAEAIGEEIGDLLFAASSLCRKLELDSEEVLLASLKRFESRFSRIETELRQSEDHSIENLDRLWALAKSGEKDSSSGEGA